MRWFGMTALALGLVTGATSCKLKPEQAASADGAGDSVGRLALNDTAPPADPIAGAGKEVYAMSRAELQRVPPGVLEREIAILERRNVAEKEDLNQIKSFNLAMCKRLERLKKECSAQLYIANDLGLDGLGCVGADEKRREPEAEIRVSLIGSQDKSYVLVANGVYVSNEFSAANPAPIQFRREDNKVAKPPRFRDLDSLTIIAVKPGGTRLDHISMPPLDQFRVGITVNGQALLPTDQQGHVTLAKSDDPDNDWSYRFDPNGVARLGRAPVCVVTLKELKELQENSKVR